MTRADDDIAVFIAEPHEAGAGFHQVALLGQADAKGTAEKIAPGDGAGHCGADWGDHNGMGLRGAAWQPIPAKLGQNAQSVMPRAFGPGKVFIEGWIGLREIEVRAFRQPEAKLIKER